MKKKELIAKLNELDLKMSVLMSINDFDLKNYIEQVFYEERESHESDINILQIFVEEYPFGIIEQLHGLDNEMFTALIILYFPTLGRYVRGTCDINSYDNCIDDDYAEITWKVVKPITKTVTVYE